MLGAITKEHLHLWVREIKSRGFARKTENDYISSLSTFLKWCTKRGAGEINNSLEHVERKKTKGDTTTIQLQEFKEMMELVTPENGKGDDSWIDSKTGKTVFKSKNFYRDWLPDGLWLGLLLGGRGDDITAFKWNEIHHRTTEDGTVFYWIELFDHKYFNANDLEQYHHIPIYQQTYQLLMKLGLKEKLGSDGYVLAPEEENRNRMKRIMGESFRWFWRMKVGDKTAGVKFKSLRSTFITIATILAGDQYQLIQKHTNLDTTRKHYYDKSLAVSTMFGQDFFDIKSLENAK
jgi:integrase